MGNPGGKMSRHFTFTVCTNSEAKAGTSVWKKGLIGCVLLGVIGLIGFGNTAFSAPAKADEPGVELTVYNENLALVKERRRLNLPSGIGNLSFTEVAAQLDPTSVKFNPLGAQGVRVLEQNYEYDVVNDLKLLQKYIGAQIKITDTKGVITEGYLMGATDNIILSSQPNGGEVRVLKAAQIQAITFPELPNGLVTRPTLVWLLQNPGREGPQLVEVSYLTGGLSWKADYVATINETDDRVDLTGWVTLDNQSGGDYANARLKLVAGDLNRVKEAKMFDGDVRGMLAKAAAPENEASFEEQSFFEYHLYTLARPTTLKNFQVKQVELLAANDIPAKKLYIYEGAVEAKKVKVMLEVKNSKEQNLGMPLPKGRIRVQKADHEGSVQLIGEDRIDHTPQDEKVRLYLGNAFDIIGERVKTETKTPSERVREESYRVTLRNHKKETVTVTAVENLSRWSEWKIIKNDQPYTKTEAGKAEFNVRIPANSEAAINYTVRYSW
jgi:hypothetical protein